METITRNKETIKQHIKTLKQAKSMMIQNIGVLPSIEEGKHYYKSVQHLNSYIMQLDEELQKKTFCKWCNDEINKPILNYFCCFTCRQDYYGE